MKLARVLLCVAVGSSAAVLAATNIAAGRAGAGEPVQRQHMSFALARRGADGAPQSPVRVPVVYCTDLFHPHDDPDDHFDLATIYSLPGLELKGIVLDQGAKQLQRPGRIPVAQLNALAGRQVPVALGLAAPLSGPADTALHQPAQFQAGVEMILDTLRQSPEPVTLITVGSVRDVVAAFNRAPDLVRRRTARVLCFIGEARREDYREYNVGLDLHAYVGLMRSGLPLEWVPCFDGGLWQNQGHASFWKGTHAELLRRAPDELLQYFIYALERENAEPIGFLKQPVDRARREKLLAGERNLWCTVIFASAAGQRLTADGQQFRLQPPRAGSAEAAAGELFGFDEVELSITDGGVVRYGAGPGAHKVRRFAVRDRARYATAMTHATADWLERFPASGVR